MSASLLDLKKKEAELAKERTSQDKGEMAKNLRLQEYKNKRQELQEKERDLSQKTNDLVDELVDSCEDTPFHKALIKNLKNLKGTYNIQFLNIYIYLTNSLRLLPVGGMLLAICLCLKKCVYCPSAGMRLLPVGGDAFIARRRGCS